MSGSKEMEMDTYCSNTAAKGKLRILGSSYSSSYYYSTSTNRKQTQVKDETEKGSQQLSTEDVQHPSAYLAILRNSKDETKLLYACNGIAQSLQYDKLFGTNKEEETVHVTYQLMINHPLNSELLQSACNVIWHCNQKLQFRESIEECEVYRPILSGIKNHKQDPYFLGTALKTVASLAESALSCKGLRQSEAYLDIISVLELYKYHVSLQTCGLLALANVLQDDLFAQNNLIQLNHHKLICEILQIHNGKGTLVSNGCQALRQLASSSRCQKILLENEVYQLSLLFLKQHENDSYVVTCSLGLIDNLSSSESSDFIVKASTTNILFVVFSSLLRHSDVEQICVYGLSIIDHLCSHKPLLKGDVKMEAILQFMYTTFEQHGDSLQYQEAFCRSLARLLELNSSLYMFIDDLSHDTAPGSTTLRVPLLPWVWIVLLSSIHDTQRYKVFQAVSLDIYYLVVECQRLRTSLLQRGAAEAVFEGLRQFISLSEPKFEKCVQYGCQALVSLIMNDAPKEKEYLVTMDIVYDFIDILENFITSPSVTAEALGVIACLSDIDEFRKELCRQNIHTRILNLIQYRPTHTVLIESAIEVLIILTHLEENMHSVFNEAGIFKEILEILDRDMGGSISYKSLMLIHMLGDEEYLGMSPKDGHRIAWILSRFLVPNELDTLLTIEALVCTSSLCKTCPTIIPQLLVECEVDVNLLKILYGRHNLDDSLGPDNPENVIYELAIDNIHSMSLNEQCRQKMLLSAIKYSMIEAIKLLVEIGADINYSQKEDCSDSPIYHAVLSKDKDVVEYVLESNVTNRNQLKEALSLARFFQLDAIIGLILKPLGLDKHRRTLNLGGLDLVEIRPLWIQPSLGLKPVPVRGHRRHRSLDFVADGIKRRSSVDYTESLQSPLKFLASNAIKTFDPDGIFTGRSNPDEEAGEDKMKRDEEQSQKDDQRGITEPRCVSHSSIMKRNKPVEYEDPSVPSTNTSAYSSTPSRYLKSTERQKRPNTASRPPTLPTVLSSPIGVLKSSSMPEMMQDSPLLVSLEMEGKDQFVGSHYEKGDYIDGDKKEDEEEDEQEEKDEQEEEEEEEEQERVPERRHCEISRTITGSRHVAFNTLERYHRGSSHGSITDLVTVQDHKEEPFSPRHIRRAAQKSLKLKHKKHVESTVSSNSVSSFFSSDETSLERDQSYQKFLESVTTTSKEVRSELLSSLKSSQEESKNSSEGVDETDGPPPVAKPPVYVNSSFLICSLDLSSNKLKSLRTLVEEGPEIAKGLRELTTLDVQQNSLMELPHTLFQELIVLEKLSLNQNQFKRFPLEISLCNNLIELNLSHNLIVAFPSERIVLPNLEKLDLSNNSLSAFPSILNGDNLNSLRVLQIDSNLICFIDDKDIKLKNLQELTISKNSIKELPFTFLAGMTSLKSLDVSRNCVELLPGDAAEYMCSLQDLKMAHNKLGKNEPDFQSFVKTALVIQYVDATDNILSSFPPPYMWRSRGLKHLLLGNNKITSLALSDCDRFWPNMERLVLSDNKLREIPPEIGKLRTLSVLDISHNRDIKHLPNEMGKLEYLFYLNLKGLKNLDVDVTQNARAIVRYLKSKLIQSKPCYTMKMMIVGGAGKGKTTLLNLLINEQRGSSLKLDNTATLGVNIRKWIYEHRPNIKYTINCWDFAGQEEFYSTHQCFLTPRSIYVLVYNLLKGETELDSLLSWLLNIQARAPGSHVIVVGTHRDMIPEELFSSVKKTMRSRVNDMIYKPGFPKDITFAEISCVGKKTGLDSLRNKIKEKIDDAKLRNQKIMGEMVPASYLELCDILEEEAKQLNKTKSNLKLVRGRRLSELMNKAGLDQKMDRVEMEQAIQFLHECGVLLHYDDIKSNLSDLYFLDPQWLCSMMAKVITIKQLTMVSNGILKVRDLPLLLKGSQYPPELISEYIRLLEWFDVALHHTSDSILIPSYLPKHKPGPITLPPDRRIVRRYSMCFIPPGFWPRLVVRLLSFPRKAIQVTEPTKQMYWYCGLYSFWSLQAFFIIEQLEGCKTMFDITVPNTAQGIRLLCSVVDNVEVLIDEWFPGLRNVSITAGDSLVCPFALCPLCPAYKQHSFSLMELQQTSITNDDIKCPVHKDNVPMKLLAPDIIIGDLSSSYHVSRDDIIMDETSPASVLGKGGFGEVLKGFYKNMNIAVKIFSPLAAEMHNTTPNQLLRQEVSILSQMVHPNIIRLVGVCLRPKPMLLLEYAELGSLASFSPYINVSNNLKHRIAIQVASALAFLHKNNVIYRDLKPGNILIFSLSFNAKVNAKLSDYGISTYATETGLTQDVGTPGYKAPELLRAKISKMPYDSKVDVYCYGIVLFQLITNGHTPFEEFSPYERDKAIEEGRSIRSVGYYGCPPWPDMHDIIQHCLQYNPSNRPSAQEIFDRQCRPEFLSLRHVVPIHQNWEVICFTIRNFKESNEKRAGHLTEVWMSSCDVSQQSMLSCVNLSKKQAQPQGRILPYNNLILSMVSIGSSLVLLGTNSGDVLVCDGYDNKKEHKLEKLPDSVLCLSYVKARGDNKAYVFAGLANGMLVAYDQCVLQTPGGKADTVITLNHGPVRGIKRLHAMVYIISGLEVFVVDLSTLAISFKWTACDDPTRRFLSCIEVGEDMVWTSIHKSPKLQLWDCEDGSLRRTINTFDSVQTLISGDVGLLPIPHSSKSSSMPLDPLMCRITAMYLQISAPSLLWVGLATGHLLVYDANTCIPLMATLRHVNAIRHIQTIRTSSHERSVNVVLTCGLGFRTRPGNQSPKTNTLDCYGVLLLWDCTMPRVKNYFDEMRSQQLPYR